MKIIFPPVLHDGMDQNELDTVIRRNYPSLGTALHLLRVRYGRGTNIVNSRAQSEHSCPHCGTHYRIEP